MQPQLIVSISAGYLVFIGLIVAASASVMASDRVTHMPWWARLLLFLPLAVSAFGGIAALIGANIAHNLGRGLEKLARPNLTGSERTSLEAGVKEDRGLAADAIWWALACAIISALLLLLAMLPIVFYPPERPEPPTGPPPQPPPIVKTLPSFEWLGDVRGFRLSETDPTIGDYDQAIARIRHKWCAARKAGREGVMLIVGSTDRVRLGNSASRRFDSNVGLGQARASSIASLLFPLHKPAAMIALAAGPTTTPADHFKGRPGGFEQDRKVSIWAFWQPAIERKRQTPECAD